MSDDATVVVVTGGGKDLTRRLRILTERQDQIITMLEALMADFTRLDETVAGLGTALQAASDRIQEDFAALMARLGEAEMDTADQEAVDALAAKLQASVDQLNAIDPVAPQEPEQPTPVR